MDKSEFFKAAAVQTGVYRLNGQDIEIHELTVKDRMAWREAFRAESRETLAMLIVYGCDLFTAEDIPQIMALSHQVVEDMSGAILRLSGLVEDEQEKKA